MAIKILAELIVVGIDWSNQTWYKICPLSNNRLFTQTTAGSHRALSPIIEIKKLFKEITYLNPNWANLKIIDLVNEDYNAITAIYSCMIPFDSKLKNGYEWKNVANIDDKNFTYYNQLVNIINGNL